MTALNTGGLLLIGVGTASEARLAEELRRRGVSLAWVVPETEPGRVDGANFDPLCVLRATPGVGPEWFEAVTRQLGGPIRGLLLSLPERPGFQDPRTLTPETWRAGVEQGVVAPATWIGGWLTWLSRNPTPEGGRLVLLLDEAAAEADAGRLTASVLAAAQLGLVRSLARLVEPSFTINAIIWPGRTPDPHGAASSVAAIVVYLLEEGSYVSGAVFGAQGVRVSR